MCAYTRYPTLPESKTGAVDPDLCSTHVELLRSTSVSTYAWLCHYSLPNAGLPAVHATCKLGLGLSPSRQSVIRYNDSTVIRCYVRPYSPHYAPSLVLSNVPYFRSVRSVAIPSPNLLSTYCRRKLDNNVIIKNIRGILGIVCGPLIARFSVEAGNKDPDLASRTRVSLLLCTDVQCS